MILACVVKVVMSWWLTAIPFLGIKGASMATVADFAVAAIINMGFIYKYTGFTFSIGSLLKPFFAAGMMGAVIYAVLSVTEQLGMWCVLFAMAAAVPSYAVALMAFGGLTKEDLENIPFVGRKVLTVGQRLGFFK